MRPWTDNRRESLLKICSFERELSKKLMTIKLSMENYKEDSKTIASNTRLLINPCLLSFISISFKREHPIQKVKFSFVFSFSISVSFEKEPSKKLMTIKLSMKKL